jgi:hypothetical protein
MRRARLTGAAPSFEDVSVPPAPGEASERGAPHMPTRLADNEIFRGRLVATTPGSYLLVSEVSARRGKY